MCPCRRGISLEPAGFNKQQTSYISCFGGVQKKLLQRRFFDKFCGNSLFLVRFFRCFGMAWHRMPKRSWQLYLRVAFLHPSILLRGPVVRRNLERFRLFSPSPGQFKIKRYAALKKCERFVYLPKMGMPGGLGCVKMVQDRPIDGTIKNLAIKGEGQMWFGSFITQYTVKPVALFVMHASVKMLGVDRGVRRPVATSDGVFLGTNIITPELQAKQARLARAVSRKQEALRARHGITPGGWLKGIHQPNALVRAKVRLAKLHAKMARKRKDQARSDLARARECCGCRGVRCARHQGNDLHPQHGIVAALAAPHSRHFVVADRIVLRLQGSMGRKDHRAGFEPDRRRRQTIQWSV